MGAYNYFTGCRYSTNVWIKANFDAKGVAHDVDVIGGVGADTCKANLVKKFSLGKFIPAYHNGKAVPAQYIESFWHVAIAKHR